jgi:predicted TIM-barrel fold metal-dependent hydrolase
MNPMPVIDAWIQFPNERFQNDPIFDSLRRWPTHSRELAAASRVPTAEEALGQMRLEGVSRVVACAWWGPRGPMIGNDEVAEVVRRHPDRVRGVASVDLLRPMDGVRELRRAVKQLGLSGLRLLPWLWGLPPDDRRYYPLYAECVELGIPFCTQVGHAGPMCPSEPGRPIPYLDHVAHEFPELVIVGGHVGVPWLSEMVSLAMKHPNVYIDTSAYKCTRYPAELVEYMKGPGRRKVLFGSNYPMLTAAQCLQGLEGLALPDEVRALFLGGNAARVYGLA